MQVKLSSLSYDYRKTMRNKSCVNNLKLVIIYCTQLLLQLLDLQYVTVCASSDILTSLGSFFHSMAERTLSI